MQAVDLEQVEVEVLTEHEAVAVLQQAHAFQERVQHQQDPSLLSEQQPSEWPAGTAGSEAEAASTPTRHLGDETESLDSWWDVHSEDVPSGHTDSWLDIIKVGGWVAGWLRGERYVMKIGGNNLHSCPDSTMSLLPKLPHPHLPLTPAP
jgi:hypothetical protein